MKYLAERIIGNQREFKEFSTWEKAITWCKQCSFTKCWVNDIEIKTVNLKV